MKFTKRTAYLSLFGILYAITCGSSLIHAVDFFNLANNEWMAGILAFAFEIGQAAVLFSLLTSKKDRSRVMPWILMGMFTLVQIIGNVYSSYKHVILNSVENLRFFKEPIFIWTDLPDDQATVIIVYLVGGLLPLSSLMLTAMITNYLEDNKEVQPDEAPQELTEEEMIAKLKEMNPDLHIGFLDGPPEGEGRSDQQEIDDLKTLLEDKEKEATNLQETIEAGKAKIDELYSTLDEQDNTINAQSDTIDDLSKKIDIKDNTIDDLSKKIDIKDKALEDLNTEVAAKEFELNSKNNEIEELHRLVEHLKENIADKDNTLAEQNKEIEDLKAEQKTQIVDKQPAETVENKERPAKSSHFINLTK